jgi:uncharacterized protein
VSTLDNFRTEVRRWLKALRAGDAAASERLRRVHPKASAAPTLRDVQHALAREHGCDSWVALRARLSAGTFGAAPSPLASLLAGANTGDAGAVAAVLDANPGIVNERGTLPGHTGLRAALHFGVPHINVVRTLLDRGADPNVRDEGDNAMPLHFAVERGDLRIIRLLVEHGADTIGTDDGHELDVIGWATCFGKGDPEVVDYLLAHGAVHNIFSAVAMGAIDAIRELVARSPTDLDRPMDRTNHRRRPLHLAVVKKQPASLTTLLDAGADPETTDASGLTALDQAGINGERAMAEVLIERGAIVGVPAAIGLERAEDLDRLLRQDPGCLYTERRWGRLIVRAAERASGRIIETLIRRGASVDARDATETAVDGAAGYTALHAAAFNGNAEAAAVLLKYGADPTIRDDKYCSTPAGWANYAGHTEVRDLILEGPIDVFDAIDRDRPDLIPAILDRDPEALTRPFGDCATCPDWPDRWWPQADQTPLAWAVASRKVEAA